MSFTFTRHSQIPDIILIDSTKRDDHRGFFTESYRLDELRSYGIPNMVQENRSHSVSHTLRGLHYQLNPKAQGKLISCVNGSVLDVAVDIRRGSPTYARSVAIPLTNDFPRMVYIPPGFAHGFLVGCQYPYVADVVYKVSEYFDAALERCIRWDDADLSVAWGFLGGERGKLKMSYKDRTAPLLKDADNNFIWVK